MGTDAPARTWADILAVLLRGEDLDADATRWAMGTIMSGGATPAQIAGFAVALRAKGETVDEVEGLVQAMYDHATVIDVPGPILDIVGTGGDRAKTVNISTMASIVVAGAGAKVVKHGNRAASSASGAADLLEHLGVVLTLRADQVVRVANEVGITFCFATLFHPAFRHAASIRRDLGIPTAFNFLGPLTNPARARARAVGVFDPRMAPIMAGVLARHGTSALVFRGDDGLDELTVTGPSRIWRVACGEVSEHAFDPRAIGIALARPEDLRGGDPAYNASVAHAVLKGETGPVRDAVLLNAAAGLVALAPTEESLEDQLAAAVVRAAEAVDSGAASAVLDRWVDATARAAAEG